MFHLILSRLALLVGSGILAGVATAAWLSRFVATLLHDLAPDDPLALLGSAAALALVAVVAGWLPAHRAAHLDPTRVLREG